jgi:sigma-E factor negative regulatory protein RseC
VTLKTDLRMNSSQNYTGTIVKLNDKTVTVCIEQYAACVSCQTKGACSSADSSTKLIEATIESGNFTMGETVRIIGTSNFGLKAVLMAFVVPVVLMLLALFLADFLQTDDLTMAISALVVLLPYYSVLFLLHNKLKKQFMFYVEKMDNA